MDVMAPSSLNRAGSERSHGTTIRMATLSASSFPFSFFTGVVVGVVGLAEFQ